MFEFTIYQKPLPKKATEFFNVRRAIRGFNPSKKDMEIFQWAVLSGRHAPPYPLRGAVKIKLEFYFSIPKSFTKKRRIEIANGNDHHYIRPDIDNLCKFYFDALKELFFHDDCQVTQLEAVKRYGDPERIYVRIEDLTFGGGEPRPVGKPVEDCEPDPDLFWINEGLD